MKISLNHLKTYVDINVPVEELCDKMVMAGFEVESIEKQGELMARQMEALTTSLARMQAKVDQLCEEIDRAQE